MNKTKAVLAILSLSLAACSSDKESTSVFLAKEMCSCHFLVERSESDCRKDASLALLAGNLTVNTSSKSVTATDNEGTSPATAEFVSKRYGCRMKL